MLLEVVDLRSPSTNRMKRVYRMRCDACGNVYEGPKTRAEGNKGGWHFCNVGCYARHKREHPECWPNNVHAMNTPEAKAHSAATIHEKAARGEWRHWLGRHHTNETKQRLSELASDGRRVGERNGMYGKRHNEASRELMSEAKSKAIAAGTFRPQGTRNKKGWHESTKTGRCYFFRSSWEEAVMRKLDSDATVTTWDYECTRIPYYYGEHKRWYVPDFLVEFADGRQELWEVKPVELLSTERVMCTAQAGQAHCEREGMRFMHVTGQTLREWGIYPNNQSGSE